MVLHISFERKDYTKDIMRASEDFTLVAVTGESGMGKLQTAIVAAEQMQWGRLIVDNGHHLSQGYFGGFHELFDYIFSNCSKVCPELITAHEQAIKRLFPKLQSPHFKVPKDLTNTSEIEERTRFYHHEYQNKLLHDVFGFMAEYLEKAGERVTLIIDRADELSRTAESFFTIISRKADELDGRLRVIALYDKSSSSLMVAHESINITPMITPMLSYEAMSLIQKALPGLTDNEAASMWRCSKGNPAMLNRLIDCYKHDIKMFDYLDAKTHLDFLLSRLENVDRNQMLVDYIKNNCVSDDPLLQRVYETALTEAKDAAHRMYHSESYETYKRGEGRLRIIHALGVSDPMEQLDLLCDPSVELKAIGLYDTWMQFFSPYFTNDKMRKHGSGEDEWNNAFVNMAFILYSLGLAKISIPYLELFYKHFPDSKLTPTVLYAQSMTYGRYQVPVDLKKANEYAELNLKLINTKFRNHDKHKYIKVFAENAQAYIRAREGNFEEALRLCTSGLEQMEEVYGDQRFKLHQSILIYNTGQIYELMKKYAEAEKYYALAIKFDPYYAEYYNDMANLYCKMEGREEDAFRFYEKAIALSPSYYEVYLNRAALLEKKGDTHWASSDYKVAIDIKPDEYRAYFNYGNMLLRYNKNAEAVEQFKRALFYQTNDPEIYNNLGIAYSELDKTGNAIEAYKGAIRIKPDYASAHNNLAILLFETQYLDGAIYHAKRAVECSATTEFLGTLNVIEAKIKEAAAKTPKTKAPKAKAPKNKMPKAKLPKNAPRKSTVRKTTARKTPVRKTATERKAKVLH